MQVKNLNCGSYFQVYKYRSARWGVSSVGFLFICCGVHNRGHKFADKHFMDLLACVN